MLTRGKKLVMLAKCDKNCSSPQIIETKSPAKTPYRKIITNSQLSSSNYWNENIKDPYECTEDDCYSNALMETEYVLSSNSSNGGTEVLQKDKKNIRKFKRKWESLSNYEDLNQQHFDIVSSKTSSCGDLYGCLLDKCEDCVKFSVKASSERYINDTTSKVCNSKVSEDSSEIHVKEKVYYYLRSLSNYNSNQNFSQVCNAQDKSFESNTSFYFENCVQKAGPSNSGITSSYGIANKSDDDSNIFENTRIYAFICYLSTTMIMYFLMKIVVTHKLK